MRTYFDVVAVEGYEYYHNEDYTDNGTCTCCGIELQDDDCLDLQLCTTCNYDENEEG